MKPAKTTDIFEKKTFRQRLQRAQLVSKAQQAIDATCSPQQILTDMGSATRGEFRGWHVLCNAEIHSAP
jgi:hypothetical protein